MKIRAEVPAIRSLTIGLLSAAALVTGLVLVRQQREPEPEQLSYVPAGESQPATISLERIRASGY